MKKIKTGFQNHNARCPVSYFLMRMYHIFTVNICFEEPPSPAPPADKTDLLYAAAMKEAQAERLEREY